MSTAMSVALAKAGVVSEEAAAEVKAIPWHLRQYQAEIEEIKILTDTLKAANAPMGIATIGEILVFEARIKRNEHSEAYAGLISHLHHEVAKLG